MRHTSSIVLVLIIANTSLNRGEKLKIGGHTGSMGIISPPRIGRSQGMTDFSRINRVFGENERESENEESSVGGNREPLAFAEIRPRTGRSSEMTGFARMNRAAGLMAYPRIGRSDPSDNEAFLDLNYDEMSREIKRQGLMPFPRVGRSDDDLPPSFGSKLVKIPSMRREEVGSVGAMWFGPRLGRLHRRSGETQSDDRQWALLPLRDLSSSGSQADNFGQKWGHESDVDESQSPLNSVVY